VEGGRKDMIKINDEVMKGRKKSRKRRKVLGKERCKTNQ
jgi:hypothetical protein